MTAPALRAAAGGTAAELAAFPTQKHILVVERGHSGFFYGITFLSFIKSKLLTLLMCFCIIWWAQIWKMYHFKELLNVFFVPLFKDIL